MFTDLRFIAATAAAAAVMSVIPDEQHQVQANDVDTRVARVAATRVLDGDGPNWRAGRRPSRIDEGSNCHQHARVAERCPPDNRRRAGDASRGDDVRVLSAPQRSPPGPMGQLAGDVRDRPPRSLGEAEAVGRGVARPRSDGRGSSDRRRCETGLLRCRWFHELLAGAGALLSVLAGSWAFRRRG